MMKEKKHIFGLYFNFILYWVGILMEKDYELDLIKGGFASLLRYEKKRFERCNEFHRKNAS